MFADLWETVNAKWCGGRSCIAFNSCHLAMMYQSVAPQHRSRGSLPPRTVLAKFHVEQTPGLRIMVSTSVKTPQRILSNPSFWSHMCGDAVSSGGEPPECPKRKNRVGDTSRCRVLGEMPVSSEKRQIAQFSKRSYQSFSGNEAMLRDSRQVENVSLPTFDLKLRLFVMAKQMAFDVAMRIPGLR